MYCTASVTSGRLKTHPGLVRSAPLEAPSVRRERVSLCGRQSPESGISGSDSTAIPAARGLEQRLAANRGNHLSQGSQ